MAKTRTKPSLDAFDEFESAADRLADWVRRHAVWLAAAVVAVIAVISGTQAWIASNRNRESRAAAAVAGAQADYLAAMGAAPDALDVPELANPEAARSIRAEYAERFRALAEEHRGTVGGVLARLQAADLASDGESDAALSALEQALGELPDDGGLRAVLLERVAQVHEAAGRWAEAALAYESAGDVREFPLREFALADAARCYLEAGQPETALALYERIEAESPGFRLPEADRSRLRELRAADAGR